MIHGFSAKMLERFLITTNNAMNRASEVHSKNPFGEASTHQQHQSSFGEHDGAERRKRAQLPVLPRPVNQRHPFAPENAFGGRHSVGAGNSSNVVVDQGLYDNTLRMLNAVDDQAGEDIYKTSACIEDMCSSIYVVPDTAPRVMAITARLKASLGEFRSLTENTSIQTRRFVNEIAQIDQAQGMFKFVLEERSASEVIRNVTTAMCRQAENMQNTSREFKSAAGSLRDQAKEAREQA